MAEIMLRFLAVLITAVLCIGFGWYFSFGTDTLQHDWIFFGGGVLVLLTGVGTLFGALGMIAKQVQEYGLDGLESDVLEANVIESPPPNRGGAQAAAAAAGADSDE